MPGFRVGYPFKDRPSATYGLRSATIVTKCWNYGQPGGVPQPRLSSLTLVDIQSGEGGRARGACGKRAEARNSGDECNRGWLW